MEYSLERAFVEFHLKNDHLTHFSNLNTILLRYKNQSSICVLSQSRHLWLCVVDILLVLTKLSQWSCAKTWKAGGISTQSHRKQLPLFSRQQKPEQNHFGDDQEKLTWQGNFHKTQNLWQMLNSLCGLDSHSWFVKWVLSHRDQAESGSGWALLKCYLHDFHPPQSITGVRPVVAQ